MKKLFFTLCSDSFKGYNSFKTKQKIAFIYEAISICILFVMACSDSLVAISLAIINLIVALVIGKKYHVDRLL